MKCWMMWCDMDPITFIGTIILKEVCHHIRVCKQIFKQSEVIYFHSKARLAFLSIKELK